MATPKCAYFGKCGGCSSQHIEYITQLESKKNVLAKATGFSDVKVVSGKKYNYRNRMDFAFTKNGLGLRKKGDWKNIVEKKLNK